LLWLGNDFDGSAGDDGCGNFVEFMAADADGGTGWFGEVSPGEVAIAFEAFEFADVDWFCGVRLGVGVDGE
jgi:hypothetical protein